MSFTTIDLTNMMRGEGEWKNMQEIVRRTLKMCFEQMDKQSEQIATLVGQVGSLKSLLTHKVNRDEVDLIIKSHSHSLASTNAVAPSSSKSHVTKAEYDKLKEQFLQVRNDLERKASIRYVDESLHRKVDRSDLLVKNMQTFSAAQYSSQLAQLFQDLTDTKAQVDSISRATSDMQRDMQGAQDLHVVKNQMEAIYRSMSDYYTKNHVNALLDQKQDVSGLDSILFKKVETSTLQATTSRIEAALEDHEKAITGLRLKLNDTSLFEARSTLARNSAQPLFCGESSSRPCTARRCKAKRRSKSKCSNASKNRTDGGVSSGYDSSGSTGSCKCNNAEVGGGQAHTSAVSTSSNTARNRRLGSAGGGGDGEGHDMESVLRDGRVQALVEGLWIKVDNAEVTTQRVKQELDGFRSAMSRIETTLSQVAGAAQMEMLGLVVEEQRHRIDSILTGSTAIESIMEEFQRQQGDISDIQDFLQLPQHKPLREQLAEAGELMDVLSHRVAELGTAVGRAGVKIEAVEIVHRQLETRVQMAENGREKVMQLCNTTDLSETEFASMKDIARRLAALSQAVLGESATTTAIAALNRKQPPLSNRLLQLEIDASESEQGMKQLDARLKELKQIVTTVGFTGTLASSTGRRSEEARYTSASASGRTSTASLGSTSSRSSPPNPSNLDIFRTSPPVPAPSSSPIRKGDLRSASFADHERGDSGGTRDTMHQRGQRDVNLVGGPSPASPLCSPTLSPSRSPAKSAVRSGGTGATNHRVRIDGSRSPLEFSARADLDSSRLSVDFEQALEQMLTSINTHAGATADTPVPIQEVPSASAGRVNHYRPVSVAASAVGHGGSSSEVGYGVGVAAKSSTARISSLQRVDDRLLELKQEKERLRRLLMDRVEDL